MPKYNVLKTMEDKAGFIADNMEMEYDGIDFDDVILFYCRLDKTIYGVTDFYGESCFFETYPEAVVYFDDIVEDMREHIEDYVIDEFSTMMFTENHILFEEVIRSDAFDVSTLEDLFNISVYNSVPLIIETAKIYGKNIVINGAGERGGE